MTNAFVLEAVCCLAGIWFGLAMMVTGSVGMILLCSGLRKEVNRDV